MPRLVIVPAVHENNIHSPRRVHEEHKLLYEEALHHLYIVPQEHGHPVTDSKFEGPFKLPKTHFMIRRRQFVLRINVLAFSFCSHQDSILRNHIYQPFGSNVKHTYFGPLKMFQSNFSCLLLGRLDGCQTMSCLINNNLYIRPELT